MMEITRDVILDLLPLYVAGEASADTRALVEAYLEGDPQLDIARMLADEALSSDVPVPLNEEDRMKAYKEVKRIMTVRTITIATLIAIGLTLLCGLAVWAPVAFILLRR